MLISPKIHETAVKASVFFDDALRGTGMGTQAENMRKGYDVFRSGPWGEITKQERTFAYSVLNDAHEARILTEGVMTGVINDYGQLRQVLPSEAQAAVEKLFNNPGYQALVRGSY